MGHDTDDDDAESSVRCITCCAGCSAQISQSLWIKFSSLAFTAALCLRQCSRVISLVAVVVGGNERRIPQKLKEKCGLQCFQCKKTAATRFSSFYTVLRIRSLPPPQSWCFKVLEHCTEIIETAKGTRLVLYSVFGTDIVSSCPLKQKHRRPADRVPCYLSSNANHLAEKTEMDLQLDTGRVLLTLRQGTRFRRLHLR